MSDSILAAGLTASNVKWRDVIDKECLPSARTETCDGCKHKGKWESEVEYGYNSPCTTCKRRVKDNYER